MKVASKKNRLLIYFCGEGVCGSKCDLRNFLNFVWHAFKGKMTKFEGEFVQSLWSFL
jgi:hypothetical protein